MSINVVAGSKLFIGSRVTYKSKVTAADFSGQVRTEIGPLTTLNYHQTEQGMASQEVINSNSTQYRKTVRGFPVVENSVLPDRSDPGQIAFALAAEDCNPYAFFIVDSADCERSSVVTISIASPGVVSWVAHGLENETPVSFQTTGVLPTGIVAGTTYYVVDKTTDGFSVAATPGGTAIVTTGTQSGVQTATAVPIGETEMFYGYAMPSGKAGGEASTVTTRGISIQPISNAVRV